MKIEERINNSLIFSEEIKTAIMEKNVFKGYSANPLAPNHVCYKADALPIFFSDADCRNIPARFHMADDDTPVVVLEE